MRSAGASRLAAASRALVSRESVALSRAAASADVTRAALEYGSSRLAASLSDRASDQLPSW